MYNNYLYLHYIWENIYYEKNTSAIGCTNNEWKCKLFRVGVTNIDGQL